MRISLLFIVICSLAVGFRGQAQVQAYLTTDQFWSSEKGHYLDVSLAISGESLIYEENSAGKEQARVEVLMIVQQDSSILDFKKSIVSSPERTDSLKREFIHFERFALAPGAYQLKLEILDLFNPLSEVATVSKQLVVADYSKKVNFSDIQLAEKIEKATDVSTSRNGYNIVPYVATFYPKGIDKIRFYTELYNSELALGANEDMLVTYTIREFATGSVYGNYKQIRKAKSNVILPLMAEFNIVDLPSGNFNLLLEVMDREGNIIADREQFFQRDNPFEFDLESLADVNMNNTFVAEMRELDTLAAYIDCLRPISDDLERKMIEDRLLDQDHELMKRFFYSFWFNRNPADPEMAWNEYSQAVVAANKLYGTRIKQGYQTDRGRVFLMYGAPNTVTDRANDMNAYPYQLWHYYKAGRFNDKRFVFYLPDLVTNDYVLLHSEVPGEVKEPRWNEFIHSRNNNTLDKINPQQINSASGGRADEYFEIPR